MSRAAGVAGIAIRRPVTTAMVFLALGLLGFIAYRQLPLQLLPNYTYPTIWVQASWPGATPEAVENEILRVVEGELATVAAIEEMSAVARAGGGTIEVSFERGVDLDFAALRIEQRLARARERLPEQVFLDVQRWDTSRLSNFVMVLSFRGDADLEAMRSLAEDAVVPALSAVEGVVQVSVQGGASKQVGVFVDPDRARARGASVTAVRQAMADATRPVVAVGDVEAGGLRLPVVVDGRARRLADVADAPLTGDGRVRLSHVADVVPGVAGSTERYRVNGRTSVGLYVFKDQQSNLIGVAHRLRDRIDQFNQEHETEGLSLAVDFDAAEVMEDELAKLKERAGAGALLALLVLLIFLGARPATVALFAVPTLAIVLAVLGVLGRDVLATAWWLGWAAAAVVFALLVLRRDARSVGVLALAVPSSLLIACALFKLSDISINVLSLLGLALSVGMLLDNGIVVLEAIAARRERGDGPLEAARRGASQVQRAVLAGTVTTLVVFVPLYMVETEMSPLFRELALSVSYPLVASLIVAVTLVPMIASRMRRAPVAEARPRLPGRHGAVRPDAARTLYSVILRQALRHPLVTVVGFVLLVAGSLVFGLPLVAIFAQPETPPEQRIEMLAEAPLGTAIESVDEIAGQLEALAADLPEVDEVRTSVREGEATVTVVFHDPEDRAAGVHVGRARERLRSQVAGVGGAEVEVDPPPEQQAGGGLGLLGGGGTQETVRVSGPEGAVVLDLALRLRERLEQVPGVSRVTWDVESQRPTVEIHPDRARLAEFGLTTMELMGVVWATRREGEPARHPFRMGDEDVDLVLWVEGGDDRTLDEVREFPLTTTTGARIPLAAVSTVTTGSEPPEHRRWQRQRTVTLKYGFSREAAASQASVEQVRRSVDRAAGTLGGRPGYSVEVEHADEGLGPGKKMLYLGLALVFIVLAIAFESFLLPLLILPCVLLALAGVVWSLALTGTSVNEYVLLAGVVLLGIVVNNGILFVDRSQALLAEGARRSTAVFRAAQERLRPVLMTTATTVVGMLPLAVSTGGQQEIWPPFGRAVMGGLIASTVISLVFVPAGTLLFGRGAELYQRLGIGLSLSSLALGAGAGWALWSSELVVSELLMWVIVPPLLLLSAGLHRVAQRVVRGESPPELVATEGPVDLRVRSARKVYGGPPKPVAEYRRVERWRLLARERGMAREAIRPPTEARTTLTWQLGALVLLAVLHAVAESAWGLMLLTIPFVWLLDGAVRSLLALAGRSGVWPPVGWPGRIWPLLQATAFWGYLFLRRRPDEAADTVVLVLAGIGLAAWALLHLLARGGVVGIVQRRLAPEPVAALGGVDLDFGVGLHGLLGPNGAGKSTLMRLVVNLYQPTRGWITINGHELRANAASLQPTIGYLPQSFGVPPRLTARQYLHHQALLAGRRDPAERARLVNQVLAEVGLADRADERLGGFSGGMRQRVGIARTLLNLPRIIVVDEPTVGLDPRERIRFRNLLAELAKTRIVLLSTHVVEDIGSACQDVVVLDQGRVLFRGSPGELVETARGRAWLHDVPEPELVELQRRFKIVSSTRLVGGIVRARGVGERPEGARDAQPTLEDAYLLLLGRMPRDLADVA